MVSFGMGTELMDCVYRSLDPPFQLNVLLCVSLRLRHYLKESYNALSMQNCTRPHLFCSRVP